MKKQILPLFTVFLATFLACGPNLRAQDVELVDPQDFYRAILKDTNALLVDVRTPTEFEKGHIANALNINFLSNDFEEKAKRLNPKKTIYLYCQSGNRSGKAAAKLKELGFARLRDLKGGMIQWRAQQLPEEKPDGPAITGLTLESFKNILNTDKIVLVDYYAEWCAPCKLMEPYLKEIEQELKDKVKLVRVDADKNQELSAKLDIASLPTLQIYKNTNLTWSQPGFVEKSVVLKHLQ